MSLWIKKFVPSPHAALRLFCFPYVGGAASVYRGWPRHFGDRIEVCAVQPPGRENRIREQPFTDILALAARVTEEIAPMGADKPFAFFGHSMGAILAFEVTRELRRRGAPMPLRLIVSAALPPKSDYTGRRRHVMNDEDLVAELRRLGGTPEEVLAHDELRNLLLPLMRADFSLVDTYDYRQEEPLDIPLTVFGGRLDTAVAEEKLDGWRTHTRAPFAMRIFPGDHFYLHAYEAEVTREIARLLPLTAPHP